MNTVFVIAADTLAARSEVDNLKRLSLPEGTLIVPVQSDADLRGRVVRPGDNVIVVGAWWGSSPDRIQRIVGMFNAARVNVDLVGREGNPPMLRLMAGGEAPQVIYPEQAGSVPAPAPTPVSTPKNPYAGPTWTSTSISPPAPTSATTTGQSHAIVTKNPDVERLERDVERLERENKMLATLLADLTSWLSGVQPIEDADFPGSYWCGVCGKKPETHASGCPVGLGDAIGR